MDSSIQTRLGARSFKNVWVRLLASFLGGALLGAAVAALSPGSFWNGWLASTLLLVPALFFLISAWRWAGGGRWLGWMVSLAFLLRLVCGIGLSLALPVYGYENDCQKAGYLFKDACQRDRESFSIANGKEGLFWFSGIVLDNDQYGGLSFLSAWIYRYLSPDAHRAFIILIVGAFFAALGVPFLYQAARLGWNERVAGLAAWIYVLYPDAIFFNSSQMREPMVVGLGAIAFWAIISWRKNLRTSLWVFAASMLGMFFFSSRVAFLIGGILAVWAWLDYSAGGSGNRGRLIGLVGLGLGILALLGLSWNWFRSSSGYDVLLTVRSSGSIAQRIKDIGENWTFLFSIIYGITRPVLPAAIADWNSLPLWHGIAIIRSLGWYLLIPFLVYGLFTTLRESDPGKRRLAFWLGLTVIVWLVVSAARGGGDATDNPRYRSLFIPWLALLAAWAVDRALLHRDAWLVRWIAVEGIFVAFFTHWYLSRYFRLWARLGFWQMLGWIIFLSLLVLVGGWIYDLLNARKLSPGKPPK